MSEKDAQIRLVDLLANNGDCRLPCLWGISPGNSTYQEAKNILAPLSSISEFTAFSPEVGNILPFYINGDSNVLIDVAFLVKDNLVTSISFGGRALKDVIDKQGIRGSENVFDSKTFGAQLGVYMLPNILSTYGRPSSVMLATLGKVPPSNRDPGVNFNI